MLLQRSTYVTDRQTVETLQTGILRGVALVGANMGTMRTPAFDFRGTSFSNLHLFWADDQTFELSRGRPVRTYEFRDDRHGQCEQGGDF
jgi:hypothetical protein